MTGEEAYWAGLRPEDEEMDIGKINQLTTGGAPFKGGPKGLPVLNRKQADRIKELEAEIDHLRTHIARAPHAETCEARWRDGCFGDPRLCTCWKARV